MSNIIKIVIKNSSGYGCIDTSYNEKLSIEPQKISYSLNQWGRDENDLVKKWLVLCQDLVQVKMRFSSS